MRLTPNSSPNLEQISVEPAMSKSMNSGHKSLSNKSAWTRHCHGYGSPCRVFFTVLIRNLMYFKVQETMKDRSLPQEEMLVVHYRSVQRFHPRLVPYHGRRMWNQLQTRHLPGSTVNKWTTSESKSDKQNIPPNLIELWLGTANSHIELGFSVRFYEARKVENLKVAT